MRHRPAAGGESPCTTCPASKRFRTPRARECRRVDRGRRAAAPRCLLGFVTRTSSTPSTRMGLTEGFLPHRDRRRQERARGRRARHCDECARSERGLALIERRQDAVALLIRKGRFGRRGPPPPALPVVHPFTADFVDLWRFGKGGVPGNRWGSKTRPYGVRLAVANLVGQGLQTLPIFSVLIGQRDSAARPFARGQPVLISPEPRSRSPPSSCPDPSVAEGVFSWTSRTQARLAAISVPGRRRRGRERLSSPTKSFPPTAPSGPAR